MLVVVVERRKTCKMKEQPCANEVSDNGVLNVCGRLLKWSKMWGWGFTEREEQTW